MAPVVHQIRFPRRRPYVVRIAAVLALLVVFPAAFASASSAAAAETAAADAPAADVRLIVDVSASMGETDPANLRSDAVGLLLRMLPEDGRAGVWTYGQYVNMLVKYGTSNRLWKETAASRTASLESVGRRANLLEAVERASWDRHSREPDPAHLVLLTDGRLDISDDADVDAAGKRRLLAELAPELAAGGFRVHTLALSDQADADLLRRLAAATGGYHGRIGSPEALPRGLVSLLGWLTSSSRLPVAEQGTFRVPPGVRELTVLRLEDGEGAPLELVSPRGERFDRHTPRERVRWHVGRGYELASLDHPPAGTWRVNAPAGVQVNAYGDLAVAYEDFPGTLFPGDLHSFEFALHSHGKPVTDTAFLDLLEVSARLHGPQAETPLVVERTDAAGYQVNLLGLQGRGDYVLETVVRGPTFAHSLSLPFVLDNPMTMEVHPAGDGFVVWVQVGAAALDHDSLRMAAMVKRPPASAKLAPLERLPTGLWKLTVPGAKGLVEIALDLKGKYLNDRDFTLRTQPIRVVLPVSSVQEVNLDMQGRPLILKPSPPGAQPEPEKAGRPPAAPGVRAPHAAAPATQPAEVGGLPGWFIAAVSGVNLLLAAGLWWLLAWPRRDIEPPPALAELRTSVSFDEGTDDEATAAA